LGQRLMIGIAPELAMPLLLDHYKKQGKQP
jgi:hypothetical protein